MIQRPNIEKIASRAKQLCAGGIDSDTDIQALANWSVNSIAQLVEYIEAIENTHEAMIIELLGDIGLDDVQIKLWFAGELHL